MILIVMTTIQTLDMTTPMRTSMEPVVREKWLPQRMIFVLWVLLMSLVLVVSDGRFQC